MTSELPALDGNHGYKCVFGDQETDASLQSSRATCPTPLNPPDLPSGSGNFLVQITAIFFLQILNPHIDKK